MTNTFLYKNKNKSDIYFEAHTYFNNLSDDNICEIMVTDYLNLASSVKKQLKGYSTPIDFKEQEID